MSATMRKIRSVAVVFAVMSLLMVLPLAGAGAVEPDVEGSSWFVEECDGQTSEFTLMMEGDLSGCLYNHGWVGKVRPDGTYIEEGTETFAGCWGDLCGTFNTTYRYIASFDADGNQLTGGCTHPIVSGSGDFAGAAGGLQFNDDLETGIAYYHGVLNLP